MVDGAAAQGDRDPRTGGNRAKRPHCFSGERGGGTRYAGMTKECAALALQSEIQPGPLLIPF